MKNILLLISTALLLPACGCSVNVARHHRHKRVVVKELHVVKPRIGTFVSVLPSHIVRKVIVRRQTLYLCDGVLYAKRTDGGCVRFEVKGYR